MPLVTVKCAICGRIIKTRAKYFFRCCGIAQDINKSKLIENYQFKSVTPEKNSQKTDFFEIEVEDDKNE
jgi:hypothetical protein